MVSVGGTSYTASNLHTFEATASSNDPLFKNALNVPTGFSGTFGSFAPNKDGLSLQESSFEVNNGASLPAIYNGSINAQTRPVGSAWDVGAYESVLSGNVVLTPPRNLRILGAQ